MPHHYAGLDVSLKETSICIVDQHGTRLRESAVPTNPESIAAFLRASGLRFNRIGMEAGNLSSWLCHALASRWPVFCIETRHVKAALKAQNMKTDRNDARGLAHIMRTGWFRAVHVKSIESQKLRVLLNTRRCLLAKRLDIERQIRGNLKVFGLKVGAVATSRRCASANWSKVTPNCGSLSGRCSKRATTCWNNFGSSMARYKRS